MSKEPKRNVYVGHRYVPKIMGEWDKTESYEGLSIVTNKGTSYTSKKRVPKGIDILNEEYWVVTGNYNAQIEEYRKDVRELEKEVDKKADETYVDDLNEKITKQLTQTANVVSEFNADPTGEEDSTQAFINAINSLKTTDTTEFIPETKVTRELIVPGGSYKITKTISVPSYMTIKGAGKHITFFESYINDGSPVFDVRSENGNQQFYVNLEDFSIYGQSLNNQGIRITNTSRWTIKNVLIYDTNREGIYLEESWLGEIYSPHIKSCGSEMLGIKYPAVKLIGPSSGFGSHAVSFFGGEIHGGTADGLWLTYGSSVSLFGTTIEGIINGRGIVNDRANSLLVEGCYFEGNREHIVEISETISSSYENNYFGFLSNEGGRGHVGITKSLASTISNNFFYGSQPTKIFDATEDGTGILQHSRVKNNHGITYPLKIDQTLLDSAVSNGTVIETYDANGYNSIKGQQRFIDETKFDSAIKTYGGIVDISNRPAFIKAGNGSPEGVERTLKGLYFNMDGGEDTSAYIKKGLSNNNVSWVPIQTIRSGPTSGRPNVTTTGYMFFDISLNKPIWWINGKWVDAMGEEV